MPTTLTRIAHLEQVLGGGPRCPRCRGCRVVVHRDDPRVDERDRCPACGRAPDVQLRLRRVPGRGEA
jgi:hypothetical protein